VIGGKVAAAAFGDQPGSWPLPTAVTPEDLWLRAVAAGGQGRYGSASRDLAALRRNAPAGRLASLAHSTQGSFLRQLGWHTLARGWDGRALALAGADIYSTPTVAADGRIFFGAETSLLYALNPDGTLSDTYDTNNGINWTSPAIAGDGTIYIGNNAGDFFAIGSGSLGLAKSSWPKFHQNNQNTGLYSGKAQGSAQPGPAIDSQP
jgi:outer membrane protein assembly factor BamB